MVGAQNTARSVLCAIFDRGFQSEMADFSPALCIVSTLSSSRMWLNLAPDSSDLYCVQFSTLGLSRK